MLEFDIEKMLFTIPPEKHGKDDVIAILKEHPEVQFVSFVGIDMGGHDTDEKIPVKVFINDMEKFLRSGVQTDGSSVALRLCNSCSVLIRECSRFSFQLPSFLSIVASWRQFIVS